MINKRIKFLRRKFNINKIDGYIIPKNDEFFGEYSAQDRLKIISNFDNVLKRNAGTSSWTVVEPRCHFTK